MKWSVPATGVLAKVKRLWIRAIVQQIPALGEMEELTRMCESSKGWLSGGGRR